MRVFGDRRRPSAPHRRGLFRSMAAAGALALLMSALPHLAPPAQAAADGVLARIEAEGVMRAGTRASAPPFARKLEAGGFEGFSVDLLEQIRTRVESEIGKPVALELHEVTPGDRLDRVAAGELDIVCGITTPTWDREALVDFSVPFFRDGTRILIYRERATGGVDLGQIDIGVVEGTTTVGIISDALPTANLRLYPTMQDAMAGLAAAEVHGVANIGITLLGLAATGRAAPQRGAAAAHLRAGDGDAGLRPAAGRQPLARYRQPGPDRPLFRRRGLQQPLRRDLRALVRSPQRDLLSARPRQQELPEHRLHLGALRGPACSRPPHRPRAGERSLSAIAAGSAIL